ncbi:MAG: NRDE family protein [Bacteroidetes bacterium]|nr:NRDE family protein [Bacteroidota bacterium]MDA1119089.1 NRDE family protein [Bacteroidota bacterium]
MCLILFSWKNHPDYELIIAANRDEFYSRKTAKAHFWQDHSEVLAGRDLKAGGTWMGITKSGRFTAITNYRNPQLRRENSLSRGFLTRNYLVQEESPPEYLQLIRRDRDEYLGFNLLVGNQQELWYYNNISDKIIELKPGNYTLSNAFLNTSWPKTDLGRVLFESKLKNGVEEEEFFDMLKTRTRPEDESLPKTGVTIELERAISPIFIETESYGTCSSSLLRVGTNREVKFTELTHVNSDQKNNLTSFQFKIS